MASCIQIDGLVQAYVDGELSASERLMVEEHLHACQACDRLVRRTKSASALLFETLREDRLQSDLSDAVMAHLPEMEQPPFSVASHRTIVEPVRPTHWFTYVTQLVPILTPVILLILAALLWSIWPSTRVEDPGTLGVITCLEGTVSTGQETGARSERVRLAGIVSEGQTFKSGPDTAMLLGLVGPSHVTVYENTQIQVVNERTLVLGSGRIFLDIARDARRFTVTTPDGHLTVLGTAFHVESNDRGTEVTVINGEVLVENDISFASVKRDSQAMLTARKAPVVKTNVDAGAYLAEARSIRPDKHAQRIFINKIAPKGTRLAAPVAEQVFMVDTQRRSVGALVLRWVPDPYTEGHAGYNVYVCDGNMTPLFKGYVAPETFRDKKRNSARVMPPDQAWNNNTSLLHITVTPDRETGVIETSFTEVSAIGKR